MASDRSIQKALDGGLKIYEGSLIGNYPILGMGVTNRTSVNGDTPLGIFEITARGEYSSTSQGYKTYGPMFLNFVGIYGEAGQVQKPYGSRESIGLHGGPLNLGPRPGVSENEIGALLMNTYGCLRGFNSDIYEINNKIEQIQLKRFVNDYDRLFQYSDEPQKNIIDTVHVFENPSLYSDDSLVNEYDQLFQYPDECGNY
jgi:hypothetical protein